MSFDVRLVGTFVVLILVFQNLSMISWEDKALDGGAAAAIVPTINNDNWFGLNAYKENRALLI